ncbi:porin [Microvirga flavescens]|uniref:porin n=1 Tax=Microvirga flavescens TaxID=2249811 RepID=UPI000DDC2878|nr:porin [Microvirga flavescens]
MKLGWAFPALLLMAVPGAAGASPRDGTSAPPGISHTCMPGFIAVEGTRTCVRISGRIRSDVVTGSARSRSGDSTRIGADGRLSIDARTQMEYGPLRAVVRVQGATR